jgi:hypothetical protein
MIIYVCKSRSQEIHRTRPDYEIFFDILAGFLPAGVWHGPIPKSKFSLPAFNSSITTGRGYQYIFIDNLIA